MKKIIFPVLVLILIIFISKKTNAITISVTLPSSTDPTVNAYITTPANRITLADMLTAELYRRVGSWGSMSHIAMGMSNANANASGSGSLNGYQGYTIWAASIGVMGSTQLKSYNISELSSVLDSFKETGDAYFGIGTGVSTNVGLHLGYFTKSLDGFYINLKLMYLPPIPIQLNSYGKISPSNITAGIEMNYQIIKRGKLIEGMFSWGGLSIGTGFIYNNNTLRLDLDHLGSINAPIIVPVVNTYLGYFLVSPTISLLIKNNTFTIPVNFITSVRFLWIVNITAGVGIDFNFGSTSISIINSNQIYVRNPDGNDVTDGPGYVNFSADPNEPPAWFTGKIILGVGFKIWAIFIDIPLIFSFPIHSSIPESQSGLGFSAGLTIGAVW